MAAFLLLLPGAALAADGPLRFVDVTAASGVRFSHDNGAFGQLWLPETIGPGVVLFDADGDGKTDLLFVNGRGFPGRPGRPEEATPPALYLNQGGLRFRDATREAGLDGGSYCLGGAAADVDNDGDADLYLACLGQDRLLRNDGGHFTDVSRQAGVPQDSGFGGFGAGALFFDADRDGDLDIYTTRYVTWSPESEIFCSGDGGKTKSYCTALLYKGASPRFLRNKGDGTFEERTREAGLGQPEAKALGAVVLDIEGDGWPDLAVACDTFPNLLYRNRGDGTFEEVAVTAGVAYSLTGQVRGGMGIDAADYDRTGRPSLVVTNFLREMTGLYQNKGDLFFLDVAPRQDLGRSTLLTTGWGTFFFDYDLDGWLDLLVANGPLDPKVDRAQRQMLFRNLGDGRLADVTGEAGGDLAAEMVARGAAFADLDDDGDLDVVVAANGGPAKVFENRGGGHGNWLRLSLRGTKSNRDGLGAQVTVTAGGAAQTWLVRAGGSYLSQPQVDPTFGLGAAKVAEKVVVRWPSGAVQTLTAVAAGQRLAVVEP
jgi:hypothetical protein